MIILSQNELLIELKKLNIEVTPLQLEQLEHFYELLINYNKRVNLTRITQKEDYYLKHVYDSLTLNYVIDLNKIHSLCDIGSGAGFPGIILKIFFPHLKITLVEARRKKVLFLNHVLKELNLDRIDSKHERGEIWARQNRETYDAVVARAVAPLNILIEWCLPLVKVTGSFVAMKGKLEGEIDNLEPKIKLLGGGEYTIKSFLLPRESSQRNLVKIIKNTPTSIKFPRESREINRKPL
jgi:16S rRNA (guanine527-N7)-methyltransferase